MARVYSLTYWKSDTTDLMAAAIAYSVDVWPTAEQLSTVFRDSGIRRPYTEASRLRRMIEQASLFVTAWDDGELVGVARALTDFSYCCYLSDLAVVKHRQRQGIGRALLKRLRDALSEEVSIILVAAPEADDYYGGVGFERVGTAWRIQRRR